MSGNASLGTSEDIEALFEMLGGGAETPLARGELPGMWEEADFLGGQDEEAEELNRQLNLTASVLGKVVGAALDDFFLNLSDEDLLDKFLPAVLSEMYCEEDAPGWLRGAVLDALADEVQVEVSIITGEAPA